MIHVRCEDSCIGLCFSRVPNRLSRILIAKSHGRRRTTLCTGAAAFFDAPHTNPHPPRASPASHFVLLTTPPRHPPPYTLLDYAFALISLVTATLLQPENCNRSHIGLTTRLPILQRALPTRLARYHVNNAAHLRAQRLPSTTTARFCAG